MENIATDRWRDFCPILDVEDEIIVLPVPFQKRKLMLEHVCVVFFVKTVQCNSLCMD